jgi:hypothetical protein
MTKKEITDLIAKGTPVVFSIDHKQKAEFQRKEINSVLAETKKALAQSKSIQIIILK